MDDYFYTTIEVQKRNDGSYGVLTDNYYEEEGKDPAYNRAEAKYHAICSEAALSGIPYHAAYLLRSDGSVKDESIYDRRPGHPQPA